MRFNTHIAALTTIFAPTAASKINTPTPELSNFIDSVVNGHASEVVGIYIPGVLKLPVGQQPKGETSFVTREPNQTTQFRLASRYGTIGILAHNDLAGAQFDKIHTNQTALIVYGDGQVSYYQVSQIEEYQALTPASTTSDFIDLNQSGERLSANQLFMHIYAPGNRLVFQTCIEAQGDPSWGRMFIIAQPIPAPDKQITNQPADFSLNLAGLFQTIY